ncbi:MAG: CDP-diacylglycerol--serine O-phosphatidyltransferase [Fermentimonas sp.]|jgi:CDP-diacylglycerol--serine O-phosphatidyltransferase|nr:CDP-diacylglycerol--serine O-phosphatidyltransferase [Fermentimonas sp.]NLC85617.1 CDP-diacylglycerol--serine O-phosphatidyltransferase [Bacteroidales bacterium]MDD2931934.1 CDP-diacylglycerol--serine O-phosphatidyltransferase [Fermentimonas sp.]MDD3189291.1 CDP-diacylglycerol--serine O-phosphatidyltransferase [Fermentimonas sp.]MDD3510334.1 CDP-diacylglycerol--serine O-phosphatidyltransferase [Fermentimonas sp.]
MKKHIPNILTLLNLFSGCIAITLAFKNDFEGVVVWIAIAAVFDFLDGMAARLLKVYSPLGKELDSLADVVSFGVAPATALYILMRNYFLLTGLPPTVTHYAPYLAFIIPLFSAYRLAKFNIDERQTSSFIGLPTPANGLFWISYSYGLHKMAPLNELFFLLTIMLILLFSWLMISDIPMFSLKINKIAIKGNERQLLIILLFILFTALWGITGLALVITAYIIISIFTSGINSRSVK